MLLSNLTPVIIILLNDNVGRGEHRKWREWDRRGEGYERKESCSQAVAKQRNNQVNVSEGIVTSPTPLVFHVKYTIIEGMAKIPIY